MATCQLDHSWSYYGYISGWTLRLYIIDQFPAVRAQTLTAGLSNVTRLVDANTCQAGPWLVRLAGDAPPVTAIGVGKGTAGRLGWSTNDSFLGICQMSVQLTGRNSLCSNTVMQAGLG